MESPSPVPLTLAGICILIRQDAEKNSSTATHGPRFGGAIFHPIIRAATSIKNFRRRINRVLQNIDEHLHDQCEIHGHKRKIGGDIHLHFVIRNAFAKLFQRRTNNILHIAGFPDAI